MPVTAGGVSHLGGPRVAIMVRNVLVTGGSSGIGEATVRRFAAAGDAVWFTYRSGHDRATRLVGELTAEGADALALELDQGDEDSLERMVGALPGPVDVLVNNAGLGTKTVEAHAPGSARAQDEALMRVDGLGPLWLTDRLVPGMVDRGYGKVLFVASVGGGIAVFPQFRRAEQMAKAGVAYLTRQLAAELVHTPVDVTCVCPGAVDTPMFRASTLDGLDADERRAVEARLPKGRLIEPAEIAEVVHWLTTDAGRVLHGAVLDASLGLGVHPGLLTGTATT